MADIQTKVRKHLAVRKQNQVVASRYPMHAVCDSNNCIITPAVAIKPNFWPIDVTVPVTHPLTSVPDGDAALIMEVLEASSRKHYSWDGKY